MRALPVALLLVTAAFAGCLGDGWWTEDVTTLEPVDVLELPEGDLPPGTSLAVSSDGGRLATIVSVPRHGQNDDRLEVHLAERTDEGWANETQVVLERRTEAVMASLDFGANGERLLVGIPLVVDEEGNKSQDRAFLIDLEGEPELVETFELPPGLHDPWFGTSVALSKPGDTAFVGAYSQRQNVPEGYGAVHVFDHSEEGWDHSATLTGTPLGAREQLGTSVDTARDGDRVIVNAHEWTDIGCPDDQHNKDLIGHVFVFDREGSDWAQSAHLQPLALEGCEEFGATVRIDDNGSRAIVTAPSTHRSSAYVYHQMENGFWEGGRINPDEFSQGTVQRSAAISSSGSLGFIATETEEEDRVHGFAINESENPRKIIDIDRILDIPNPRNASMDSFGDEIAYANGLLFVGAEADPGPVGQAAPSVFVYEVPGTAP